METDRQTSEQRMVTITAEKVLPRVFLDGSRRRGKATGMSIRGNPAHPIARTVVPSAFLLLLR